MVVFFPLLLTAGVQFLPPARLGHDPPGDGEVVEGRAPVRAFAGRRRWGIAVHRDALRPLWRRPRAIIGTVLVQSTVPLLLLTYGQKYVSASFAGILVGAQPLFVALLAVRFARDERPHGWKGAAGIGLGLAGLVLLFGVDIGGARAILGGALVVAAALCYAGGAITIHRRHADAPPLGVAASTMLVTTAALVLPASLAPPIRTPGVLTGAALVVLGVACTGATLVLFYTLIARTALPGPPLRSTCHPRSLSPSGPFFSTTASL